MTIIITVVLLIVVVLWYVYRKPINNGIYHKRMHPCEFCGRLYGHSHNCSTREHV